MKQELKKYLVGRLKMLHEMIDGETDNDTVRFYEGGIIEVESLWAKLVDEPIPSLTAIRAGLTNPPTSIN